MNKLFTFGVAICFATASAAVSARGQTPTPVPEPASVQPPTDGRSRREQALAKLFEGQRHMWKLQRMQTQAGRAESRKLAKDALEASVSLDPTLAEGYTALSQLAVAVPPRDIEEGIRQADRAVKADRQNLGGHRMLARLYTAKSRLSGGPLDASSAQKAQAEWREVARLDPRNAEAWAFLAAFAESLGKLPEQIDALRRWVSSSSPADVGFYEGTMGGASLSPESASIKLASALIRLDKTAEAASILGDLISEDPENAEAIGLLGEIVDSLEGNAAAATVAALQQAVYANPESVMLVDALARLQARAGRFEEATELLKRQAAALSKADARAASTLAISLAELYLQKDRYDDSAAALEKALSIRSLTAAAGPVREGDREFAQLVFEKLIHVAKLVDRPQAAKAYIERARKLLGKDDPFADRQMIMLLRSQGSLPEALSLIRVLRLGRPDDVGLLRMEANMLVDAGQVDAAVTLINRSRSARAGGSGSADPPEPGLSAADEFSNLLFISNLYSRARRGSEAIEAANGALAAAAGAERRQIAKTTLATAQEMNGDLPAAEKTLREVLAETPGNPMALNNLGYFLTERGEDLPEAVKMINQALKVDPRNPSYLDSLGWAYFKLGRLGEAEKYLSDAMRIDPDSGTIREHLGDLYRQRKETGKARAMWEIALRLSTDPEDIARIRKKLAR